MKTVSVATLKSRLSHFLRLVRKGDEVVITSHDHPVGKLVPYGDAKVLHTLPATRPPSYISEIPRVDILKSIDVVALLRQDRDQR